MLISCKSELKKKLEQAPLCFQQFGTNNVSLALQQRVESEDCHRNRLSPLEKYLK